MNTGGGARRWATPPDVVATLSRRWRDGSLLRSHLTGRPWTPLSFPIAGPSARDVLHDHAAVQDWAHQWTAVGNPVRVTTRAVGGRLGGINQLPDRAWLDTADDVWSALEVTEAVRALESLKLWTPAHAPTLSPWFEQHPLRVLGLGPDWQRLCRTVSWIADRGPSPVYLRQVDVPGVDTKFIERHRGVLAELLDQRLPAARIADAFPRSSFEQRYGFLRKPALVRFRPAPDDPRWGDLDDITLTAADFHRAAPAGGQVLVLENETTFLALPRALGRLVVFGRGYALSALGTAGWLADREVVYWGDIDTHGLVILDRLRQHFPAAMSVLMDRATLHAHPDQWVTEPSPVSVPLRHLQPDEAQLYSDLVENTFGVAVRLEQERVQMRLLANALPTPTPQPFLAASARRQLTAADEMSRLTEEMGLY